MANELIPVTKTAIFRGRRIRKTLYKNEIRVNRWQAACSWEILKRFLPAGRNDKYGRKKRIQKTECGIDLTVDEFYEPCHSDGRAAKKTV